MYYSVKPNLCACVIVNVNLECELERWSRGRGEVEGRFPTWVVPYWLLPKSQSVSLLVQSDQPITCVDAPSGCPWSYVADVAEWLGLSVYRPQR